MSNGLQINGFGMLLCISFLNKDFHLSLLLNRWFVVSSYMFSPSWLYLAYSSSRAEMSTDGDISPNRLATSFAVDLAPMADISTAATALSIALT